ncbi:MMPL family transporter [Mycobacterium sp. Y57]|nr:MMPL family transporter [Mycolicibacterium xanthum]MBX7431848.1 MMPL family transporter [Mycolicibacterium xanthum]
MNGAWGSQPLQSIGRMAWVAPRRILVVAVLLLVAAGIFGAPVVGKLSSGGFKDPAAESSHAAQVLSDEFGIGATPVVIAVTSDPGVRSPVAQRAAAEIERTLAGLPYVRGVQSAWSTPSSVSDGLVSRDGKTGLIVAGIAGDESTTYRHADEIASLLTEPDGVAVKLGGEATSSMQSVEQAQRDLLVMELISVPLSFVVLVWVFGGLLTAALPLAVGVLAIVGSLAVVRAFAMVTDVSVFALNVILALGLALAIDYTLLIVSRFRDELATGAGREEALMRTMATAGRTVVFSAVTVALGMGTMVLFPIYFLKSFAYGGVAVVALAAAAALVVTPAALVLLGARLDAFDVRRLARRALRRPEPVPPPVHRAFWYRWATGVMRHAVPIGLAVTAALVLLGTPIAGIRWGFPDDRMLPTSMSARQVGDDIRANFTTDSYNDVIVVVPNALDLTVPEVDGYAARLSRVPGVASVSAPGGAYTNGVRTGPPVAATALSPDSVFLTVNSRAPLYSESSAAQLDQLHAVSTPGGRSAQFTGWAQVSRDCAAAVTSTLPLVLSVIAVITVVLMFVFTGSIVLALATLVLNVLSLAAMFGAVVWIFQDGHLGGFGTTATGTLAPSVLMLLFCMAFGLSMDYQLFVIARIREHWTASARTGSDSREAVAVGLARTGRVVTAAAVLMAVTLAALLSAQVSVMKIFGFGLPLAVLVDATVVRMILLPTVLRLLGRAAWWEPAPLAWLHRHIGVEESADIPALSGPLAPEGA